MRIVVQRTLNSKVIVDGKVICEIEKGIVALVGINSGDDDKVINFMLDKIINLRIFEDENEKLNLSLKDINGGLIIVPNFTIYGDARNGRRPSFSFGAKPSDAKEVFDKIVERAKILYNNVGFGIFQADMKINLINDGPVTILLDSDKLF